MENKEAVIRKLPDAPKLRYLRNKGRFYTITAMGRMDNGVECFGGTGTIVIQNDQQDLPNLLLDNKGLRDANGTEITDVDFIEFLKARIEHKINRLRGEVKICKKIIKGL